MLARASALAPDPGAQAFFARGAAECLDVEQARHDDRLARAGTTPRGPASAVTTAYVDHLLAVAARGSYAEVVAAVLPCYWLYSDLGARIRARAGDLTAHRFGDWIGLYGDPRFAALTAEACALVDAAAREAGAATRERMRAAFVTSCAHEVAFFGQTEPTGARV